MLLRPSFLISALSALASILLVVATPAKATPIVIDDFQISQNQSAVGGAFLELVDSLISPGSFGGLDRRGGRLVFDFFAPSGQGSASFVVGSGTGTLAYSSPGSPNPPAFSMEDGPPRFWYRNGGPENWTANGNNTLKVTTGNNVAFSGLNNLEAFVTVRDTNSISSTHVLPSLWQSNTTYEFPYTLFPGVNFSLVDQLSIGVTQPVGAGASDGEISGSLSLTSISAVPEPGTIAMLATGGVAIAAGLIRRRRIAAMA